MSGRDGGGDDDGNAVGGGDDDSSGGGDDGDNTNDRNGDDAALEEKAAPAALPPVPSFLGGMAAQEDPPAEAAGVAPAAAEVVELADEAAGEDAADDTMAGGWASASTATTVAMEASAVGGWASASTATTVAMDTTMEPTTAGWDMEASTAGGWASASAATTVAMDTTMEPTTVDMEDGPGALDVSSASVGMEEAPLEVEPLPADGDDSDSTQEYVEPPPEYIETRWGRVPLEAPQEALQEAGHKPDSAGDGDGGERSVGGDSENGWGGGDDDNGSLDLGSGDDGLDDNGGAADDAGANEGGGSVKSELTAVEHAVAVSPAGMATHPAGVAPEDSEQPPTTGSTDDGDRQLDGDDDDADAELDDGTAGWGGDDDAELDLESDDEGGVDEAPPDAAAVAAAQIEEVGIHAIAKPFEGEEEGGRTTAATNAEDGDGKPGDTPNTVACAVDDKPDIAPIAAETTAGEDGDNNKPDGWDDDGGGWSDDDDMGLGLELEDLANTHPGAGFGDTAEEIGAVAAAVGGDKPETSPGIEEGDSRPAGEGAGAGVGDTVDDDDRAGRHAPLLPEAASSSSGFKLAVEVEDGCGDDSSKPEISVCDGGDGEASRYLSMCNDTTATVAIDPEAGGDTDTKPEVSLSDSDLAGAARRSLHNTPASVRLVLDMSMSEIKSQSAFEANLVADLVMALGVETSRVVVTEVMDADGAEVVVEFTLYQPVQEVASLAEEVVAVGDALTTLQEQGLNPRSMLLSGVVTARMASMDILSDHRLYSLESEQDKKPDMSSVYGDAQTTFQSAVGGGDGEDDGGDDKPDSAPGVADAGRDERHHAEVMDGDDERSLGEGGESENGWGGDDGDNGSLGLDSDEEVDADGVDAAVDDADGDDATDNGKCSGSDDKPDVGAPETSSEEQHPATGQHADDGDIKPDGWGGGDNNGDTAEGGWGDDDDAGLDLESDDDDDDDDKVDDTSTSSSGVIKPEMSVADAGGDFDQRPSDHSGENTHDVSGAAVSRGHHDDDNEKVRNRSEGADGALPGAGAFGRGPEGSGGGNDKPQCHEPDPSHSLMGGGIEDPREEDEDDGDDVTSNLDITQDGDDGEDMRPAHNFADPATEGGFKSDASPVPHNLDRTDVDMDESTCSSFFIPESPHGNDNGNLDTTMEDETPAKERVMRETGWPDHRDAVPVSGGGFFLSHSMLSDGTAPSPSQVHEEADHPAARQQQHPHQKPTGTGISSMSLGTSFNGTFNGSVNMSTASNSIHRQQKLVYMAKKLERVEAFAKEVKLKAMDYISNAQVECEDRIRQMQIDVSAMEAKLKTEKMKAQLEIKSLHLESDRHAQDLERQIDMYNQLQGQFDQHKSMMERQEHELYTERGRIAEERAIMQQERQEDKERRDMEHTMLAKREEGWKKDRFGLEQELVRLEREVQVATLKVEEQAGSYMSEIEQISALHEDSVEQNETLQQDVEVLKQKLQQSQAEGFGYATQLDDMDGKYGEALDELKANQEELQAKHAAELEKKEAQFAAEREEVRAQESAEKANVGALELKVAALEAALAEEQARAARESKTEDTAAKTNEELQDLSAQLAERYEVAANERDLAVNVELQDLTAKLQETAEREAEKAATIAQLRADLEASEANTKAARELAAQEVEKAGQRHATSTPEPTAVAAEPSQPQPSIVAEPEPVQLAEAAKITAPAPKEKSERMTKNRTASNSSVEALANELGMTSERRASKGDPFKKHPAGRSPARERKNTFIKAGPPSAATATAASEKKAAAKAEKEAPPPVLTPGKAAKLKALPKIGGPPMSGKDMGGQDIPEMKARLEAYCVEHTPDFTYGKFGPDEATVSMALNLKKFYLAFNTEKEDGVVKIVFDHTDSLQLANNLMQCYSDATATAHLKTWKEGEMLAIGEQSAKLCRSLKTLSLKSIYTRAKDKAAKAQLRVPPSKPGAKREPGSDGGGGRSTEELFFLDKISALKNAFLAAKGHEKDATTLTEALRAHESLIDELLKSVQTLMNGADKNGASEVDIIFALEKGQGIPGKFKAMSGMKDVLKSAMFQVRIHTCIYVYMLCVYVYMHARVYKMYRYCICISVYLYIDIHICVCICVKIHTYIHIYMYVFACMYVCIYINSVSVYLYIDI
jgi:hypothetical protein